MSSRNPTIAISVTESATARRFEMLSTGVKKLKLPPNAYVSAPTMMPKTTARPPLLGSTFSFSLLWSSATTPAANR